MSMSEPNDPKKLFREALERKQKRNSSIRRDIQESSKVKSSKSKGNSSKLFRRKSGTS